LIDFSVIITPMGLSNRNIVFFKQLYMHHPTEIPNFHTLIAHSWSSISIEHRSSESKTSLHLFQSHSDPGGKRSLMAYKMGGRVSYFQSYLGLGTQLSYVVFLAYPDICTEGVRKGFCGFWVA
jgi:hypothetical protein